MKVLVLHGLHSVPGGVKPTYLKDQGHEVINPALNDDDFAAAAATAQAEFDRDKPDVIVGSSRGGAVAMNIESGTTPLILLCPAWKKWGTATTTKPSSVILHSCADDIVPYADSEELLTNSGLPFDALIHVGNDHKLADEPSLQALEWACRMFESKEPPSWLVAEHSQLPTMTFPDRVTAFVRRVTSEIVPWVKQSTIPFFHMRKDPTTNDFGIFDKDRTGVFLRIGSEHFILTASHGIQDAFKNGTFLFVSWDDEEHCCIPLVSDQFATTNESTVDIAVIKLTEASAEKLLIRHKPIALTDIVRYGQNANGLFLIYGYSRAGTEFAKQNPLDKPVEPHLEPLTFIGNRTNRMWSGKDLKYDPRVHLMLGMCRDSYSGQGKGQLLPEHEGIQGISGCGIWLIADRSWNTPLGSIGVADCKLIAIEHMYDEKAGLVVGTWIDLATKLIAMKFPESKAAIDIVYPEYK